MLHWKWWLEGKPSYFVLAQRSARVVSPLVFFLYGSTWTGFTEIWRIIVVVGKSLGVVSLKDFATVLWKCLEEEMWLVYSYSDESAD